MLGGRANDLGALLSQWSLEKLHIPCGERSIGVGGFHPFVGLP